MYMILFFTDISLLIFYVYVTFEKIGKIYSFEKKIIFFFEKFRGNLLSRLTYFEKLTGNLISRLA